ncbi:MAG: polysaccharide biosynthesis C-terminal domain-containing protein, partial [Candidatus Magasanikbacteria bacterium]|nr:polysaccharide biosynthesis C-terminal domain-containing protein [Candidatus Magasanikbacteria bacterium]
WPFALAGIISRLYAYSDSLLMSKMLSATELGYWSVPYKITFAFQFIPAALSASIYPVMSGLFMTDKDKIGDLFLKSWRYLFAIVFPLTLGLMALASPVIIKLYKAQFAPAIPVLQILLVSLIFGFLGFVTGATLNATNRQRVQTGLLAVVLIVNIILNLILLPKLGIIGAAWAALASNIILCVGGYWFCKKAIVIDGWQLVKYFSQTFFPAVAMALLAWYLSLHFHFILIIPFSAVLYLVLLLLTGAVDKNLIMKFYNKIFPKKSAL